MKKRHYLTMISVVMLSGLSMAQAQNPECMTNLSIYAEHAKVKNYDAAYEPWKMVYESCPDINKANFSLGEKILEHKIDKSTGADKDAFIQDLLSLYDSSIKYFPSNYSKAEEAIDKALLLYDNKMASDEQLFDMLDKAFKEDRENFTNAKALDLYFSTLVELHGAGKKDLQLVFDTYDDLTEKIETENQKLTDVVTKLLPKDSLGTLTTKEATQLRIASNNSEAYGKVAGSVDAKLGSLADCNNLIPLYEKSFEAKKSDVDWVKRAVGRMFAKECTDDPLFRKLFEAQLALDPSASAFMYGGALKQKAGDTKGAIADFNKAVELETDKYKKSDILYKIATTLRRSSKSQARTYANKAIEINPANGKAYLLIANLYAGSANDCGSDPFEKRAIYWKAEDMARRAAKVDPSVTQHANQAAASYAAKAPTKEMIFNSGKAGQSISFSCWVGGSVKVPNL